MDSINLALEIRGIGMGCLILGGCCALVLGYRTFRDDVDGRSSASFSFLGFKGTSKGVGAITMMTAVAWAYLGATMAPKLDAGPNHTTVASTEHGRANGTGTPVASADRSARLTVPYMSGGTDITPENARAIEDFQKSLTLKPSTKFLVESYADVTNGLPGTAPFDQDLKVGWMRAETVKGYLVRLGVDPRKVDTISIGSEPGEAQGSSSAAPKKNNQIEIIAVSE